MGAVGQDFKGDSLNSVQQLKTTKKMETVLTRLEAMPNFKEKLKFWCKSNGIKVGFLITMSLSKAKSIHRKLSNSTDRPSQHQRIRWMEKQINLFHFSLIALSAIHQIPISQFNSHHWRTLLEAFPNKELKLLQFQATSFIYDKAFLKKKWEEQEDRLLTALVQASAPEFKWNDIAVEMFIQSGRTVFRPGKQCRERWLNHLNQQINHERWTEEEDRKLIENVVICGKRWSKIMKALNSNRTEHMIKNRFISLVLKYKKQNPFIYGEEDALKGIAEAMGIKQSGIPEGEVQKNKNLRSQQRDQKNETKSYEHIEDERSASEDFSHQKLPNLENTLIKQEGGLERLVESDAKELENSGLITACSPQFLVPWVGYLPGYTPSMFWMVEAFPTL